MAATKAKPVEEDPLGVHLQVTREGDSNATSASQRFWIAAVSQGGHTTSLYAKTQKRATGWQAFGRSPRSLPHPRAHLPALNPWSHLFR
jgi:hypothetical protein